MNIKNHNQELFQFLQQKNSICQEILAATNQAIASLPDKYEDVQLLLLCNQQRMSIIDGIMQNINEVVSLLPPNEKIKTSLLLQGHKNAAQSKEEDELSLFACETKKTLLLLQSANAQLSEILQNQLTETKNKMHGLQKQKKLSAYSKTAYKNESHGLLVDKFHHILDSK